MARAQAYQQRGLVKALLSVESHPELHPPVGLLHRLQVLKLLASQHSGLGWALHEPCI